MRLFCCLLSGQGVLSGFLLPALGEMTVFADSPTVSLREISVVVQKFSA
jgi:hypothetical protein